MSDHPHTRETRDFAREIKFLIDASAARVVRDWARARLAADVHGSGPFGDEYDTATLYFDTDGFDVFHRRGSFGRSKYRVRRYGTSDVVFFERKLRTPGRLVKRRTADGIGELARLGRAGADVTWPANWFHQRLQVRRLHPICRVSYRRTARVGESAYGPMRLTIDEGPLAIATSHLAFGTEHGTPIASGQAILELKYVTAVPAVFTQLVEEFGLVATPVSKYRLAVSALDELEAARNQMDTGTSPRRGSGQADPPSSHTTLETLT
jgi:hypothetical protein